MFIYFIAIERDAKNIQLKLFVEKEGSFELYDDGEALNLVEMEKESILLKSKLMDNNILFISRLDIRNICEYSIRTRSRLGLFSEHLDNNRKITKMEADRVYRNVFIIKDLFKSVTIKSKEMRKMSLI